MAVQGALLQIHDRIDAEAARLSALHKDRLKCGKGCSMCCVDDITVVEVEADNIRRHHADLLRRGVPHEIGMCAFLDGDGACRIYPQRPYVCRSQGLPLRWLQSTSDGPVEHRDICPLNEAGPALVDLPAAECWTIGWAESALAQLQDSADGRDPLAFDDDDEDEADADADAGADAGPVPGRIALRDLFTAPAEGGL